MKSNQQYVSKSYKALQRQINTINQLKTDPTVNVGTPEKLGFKSDYNINPNNIIEIGNPTGKMSGTPTISTYAAVNPNCKARIEKYKDNPDVVCSHCFSAVSHSMSFKTTLRPYIYNSHVLSSEILFDDQLPKLTSLWARFESHGDLINQIHAINYLNICIINPNTHFTLWTKNPGILDKAIKYIAYKPENLTIIYSSLYTNTIDTEIIKKYTFIDKVFTVFTSEYAIKNNVEINCGSKVCRQCQNCYLKADKSPVYINEILKDDIKNYLDMGGVVR